MTTPTRTARLLGALGLAAAVALLAVQGLHAQDGHLAERLRLLNTRSCDECNLSGENFTGADLKGVSAASANLTGASLYKANLSDANLGRADLSKAVLSFANLSNTNLGGANLAGANLAGAIAADLTTAVTSETTICPDGQAGPCR